jgi:hypothetical protein
MTPTTSTLERLHRRCRLHGYRLNLLYVDAPTKAEPRLPTTFRLRVVTLRDGLLVTVAELDGRDLPTIAQQLERELTDKGILT